MTRFLSLLPIPVLLLAAGPALAAPVTFESDVEAVTVAAAFHDVDNADSEDILYEVTLDNRAATVLDNGLQISARVTLRGQRDHPSRPGFLSDFGGTLGPAGAYSGLSGQPTGGDTGARGQLEAAYVEFDGGYGEARIGRDRGVAARFFEGAPSALSHASINNPYLDPDGIKILRTNHDLTGPSAKLSYATPRILGLRGGISYTPQGEAKGLDRNIDAGGVQPDLENALEVAANLSRTLRSSGLRFDASLAWSQADVSSPFATVRESVQSWSAGANVAVSGVTFGASWLSSDNGFSSADYEAWEIGAGFELGETDFTLNYGEAEDDLAVLSSEAFSIAAARDITDELRLAVAWQDESLDTAAGPRSGTGLVVEITLSSQFFEFAGN